MSKNLEKRISDGIEGRPIRINRQDLKIKPGKDYTEIVFWGDVHYGHPCCDIKRAKSMLDYCLKNNIYVIGMGDYLEAGTRYSVGDSVYQQNPNPSDQREEMVEWLKPLAKKGLLLGLYCGNHEARIIKETSFNPVKIMCKELGVRYLDFASWNLFKVGKQNYEIYGMHGASGSRYVYTKLKSVVDISHNFDADLIAMGHVHDLAETSTIVQYVDLKDKIIREKKKFLVLTGSYLKYDNSYAQEKGMPIGKNGSPKVKLFSSKKDIHISS